MTVPPDVFVIAIFAAVMWGFGPVTMKLGFEEGGTPILATVVTVIVSFLLMVSVATVVYGPRDSYLGLSTEAMLTFLAAGIIGGFLGRVVMFIGIDRVGASIASAAINSRPLFAAFLAVGLLGEPMTGWLFAGVIAITAGVVILSLSRGGDIRGWRPIDIIYPISAAIAYAMGNIIRRYGFLMTEADPLSALVFNELAALIGVVGYALARYGRQIFIVSRKTYGYFTIGGILDSIGVLALFVALSRGPVVIVDPLVGTSPLFALLLTFLLLRRIERITLGVLFGALIVILGVVFITLA